MKWLVYEITLRIIDTNSRRISGDW